MGNRTATKPLRKRRKTAVKRPPWRPRNPSSTPFARWLDAGRMTAAEVATALDASVGNVYKLRDGRTRPSLRKALAIEELTDGLVPVGSWG